MLTLFVLGSFVVVTVLVLAALDVIRPPERMVTSLFVAFFLSILQGAVWTVALILGLSVAPELERSGVSVVIIEAHNEVGGRTRSRALRSPSDGHSRRAFRGV